MLALPELTELLNRTYWELHIIWLTLTAGLVVLAVLVVGVMLGLVGVCRRLDLLVRYEEIKFKSTHDSRACAIPTGIRTTEELLDWYDNQPRRAA